MKPKKRTLTYDFLIKLVSFTKGLAFHSIEEHFQENRKDFDSPYPSALLANHVSEADIIALSIVYPRLNPKIKMIIPAREDILKKDFLQKEFRAKGLLKLIFTLIDKSSIIPLLLGYIGCVPIKRPFRDNSRELLKKGELRETVDAEWNDLVVNINSGRNLFMFPEGTYNQDGFLNQIKKGAYYLKTKITDIQFNSFTFTYDHLTYPKLKLHISYGSPFRLTQEQDVDSVTKAIKEKFGKSYVLTLGNLTSFILLKLGHHTKITQEKLFSVIESVKEKVQKKYPEILIASELKKGLNSGSLSTLLTKLKSGKYIDWKEGEIQILEPLVTIPKTLNNLKKSNIVLYHKNQLTHHLASLDGIWDSLPEASGVVPTT
ncbi:1-acyl-sn-glycerol-3-phosphate acyltransferase [Leptospira idonii]|uniref:1-acyl-sn-glycerol-3-phosphate acyltransferase n=1 Tax=Leptospira idonii TaxID=1193500 RepID=A0A4R9LVG3_9LEPT|nr:1-acyl-sn-glycerol-3-phosphate acyltransferase [Leptospira idonii]TGN18233.1 1-acyl-sn-glycerol-3-phosphate acyltransferase [Leptospira idonii]